MTYEWKNTVTGATLITSCRICGENWVEVKPEPAVIEQPAAEPKEPAKAKPKRKKKGE